MKKKNAHVLLACRSLEKANSAINKLKSLNPEGKFTPIELDLSDLNNVSEIGSKISSEFEELDLLINNAGIMHPPKTLSKQGFEIQFAVNHLAHMLLTLKLLPLVEKKGSNIRFFTSALMPHPVSSTSRTGRSSTL